MYHGDLYNMLKDPSNPCYPDLEGVEREGSEGGGGVYLYPPVSSGELTQDRPSSTVTPRHKKTGTKSQTVPSPSLYRPSNKRGVALNPFARY